MKKVFGPSLVDPESPDPVIRPTPLSWTSFHGMARCGGVVLEVIPLRGLLVFDGGVHKGLSGG